MIVMHALVALTVGLTWQDGDASTGVDGFTVITTFEVGAAPHGIAFSDDGARVYVALSGDDALAVIDAESYAVLEVRPAGEVPLDLLFLDDGRLVATQFRGAALVVVPEDGAPIAQTWSVGSGPSLFDPRVVNGVAALTCEFADQLVLFDTALGEVVGTYATGDRPYPADVTRDGILVFVPNRGDGTVSVIDVLNGEVAGTVDVGGAPEGGALLADDSCYVAACSGADELAWVNTASLEVVHRTRGVGPRPFSVAVTPDGRSLLTNDADGDTLTIVDVATREVRGKLIVGEQPIVVRMHPDGRRAWVANEVSGTVSVVQLPAPPAAPAEPRSNEVVVLGTIHGSHRTSDLYGLELLRELVRAVDPDVILTEIPPNRAEAALAGFRADGVVGESRVARFPEYVDVIYPLLDELDFELVPTAGWSERMARYRSERMAAIEADPSRADDWATYVAARTAADACIDEHGAPDDPAFIHTDVYDDCYQIALAAYDELFNDELGPGGWTHINEAHYGHIAEALDRRRGQGLRVLVTYGAGHKGWFLDALRRRDDIELLDVAPLLAQAQAALEER